MEAIYSGSDWDWLWEEEAWISRGHREIVGENGINFHNLQVSKACLSLIKERNLNSDMCSCDILYI